MNTEFFNNNKLRKIDNRIQFIDLEDEEMDHYDGSSDPNYELCSELVAKMHKISNLLTNKLKRYK